MRVVCFRVDASIQIGVGHVMRCLSLAEELKQQGGKILFICREHHGNLIGRIIRQGFKVHKLPQSAFKKYGVEKEQEGTSNTAREVLYGKQWLGSTQKQDAEQCEAILEAIKPDWLIVDHYALDHHWQASLQGLYRKLMVIDDLADRKHHCDLLLDQTYGREKSDYANFVPEHCKMLLGSQYALLRPEFAQWREYSLKRRVNPELKQLLITMGGVDLDNITGQVLKALKDRKLPKEIEITVVMGETAPNIETVKKQARQLPYKTQIKTDVNNMAELMANADLAIGAAGATTWERCCLGLPSIVVGLVDNQKDILSTLANNNIIVTTGRGRISDGIKILDTISKELLVTLSKESAIVSDGAGIKKVAKSINSGVSSN